MDRMDHAAWLVRAEAFVRRTAILPGRWWGSAVVEPPIDLAKADRLSSVLPLGLPQCLREFYVSGSSFVDCHFHWKPNDDDLRLISTVVPHTYAIYGGPRFISADAIEQDQDDLIAMADVFEDLPGTGPAAATIMRECVPIIHVNNGDYVALHCSRAHGTEIVVYIDHEANFLVESPIRRLEESFTSFLSTWERIGYLGPEIWLLNPLLNDSPTGVLDADSPLALRWQMLLRNWQLLDT